MTDDCRHLVEMNLSGSSLSAPPRLHDGLFQPWFGRPPIKACELAYHLGVDMNMLRRFCGDEEGWTNLSGSELLHPCSLVWPVGYSWSAAVAQDVTLGLLRESGLVEDHIVADSMPPPRCQKEIAFVQTDDTIFSHTSREAETGIWIQADAIRSN